MNRKPMFIYSFLVTLDNGENRKVYVTSFSSMFAYRKCIDFVYENFNGGLDVVALTNVELYEEGNEFFD